MPRLKIAPQVKADVDREINRLAGNQARIALLQLNSMGYTFSKAIQEAIAIAETYTPDSELKSF